jgi:hypothetical protein
MAEEDMMLAGKNRVDMQTGPSWGGGTGFWKDTFSETDCQLVKQ